VATGKLPVPPPRPPPRPAQTKETPAARPTGSVERVAAKEEFSADEPLPAFTYPAVDEATKQQLLKSVEEANARKKSAQGAALRPTTASVERVVAKEEFSPDEPLPAFTYPAVDEATKQELLRSVEAARASSATAPSAGPEAPPLAPPAALPRAPLAPPPKAPSRRPNQAKGLSEIREIAARAFRRGAELARDGWNRASVLARRWVDQASAFIDQNRARLPARIRDPLSKVSARVILAIVAGLVLCIIIGVFSMVGGGKAETQVAAPAPSASAPAPVPEEDPVPREIEEAKKQGTAALEKLAERYSKDHRVFLELASENSTKGLHTAAIAAVGKALAADPKANEQAIASAALADAVRKRDTTNAAFEMLAGPMGSAGATVIYDLSIDPDVRTQLRTRAEEWVKSDAFRKVAEPDVLIAGALRYAGSCSDRHDLLPRAADNGAKRTLDFLNVAKAPGGCGRRARDDCFPCLRKDSALKDAIAAIETRLAAK
jgi:hypothetical protein